MDIGSKVVVSAIGNVIGYTGVYLKKVHIRSAIGISRYPLLVIAILAKFDMGPSLVPNRLSSKFKVNGTMH